MKRQWKLEIEGYKPVFFNTEREMVAFASELPGAKCRYFREPDSGLATWEEYSPTQEGGK